VNWKNVRRHARDAMLVGLGFAVLALSAIPIDADRVSDFETETFHLINDLPGALYWGIWAVMQFGNFLFVPLAGVAAALLRRLRLAIALLASGTIVWLLAKVIKDAIERGRPGELIGEVILRHAPAAGNGFISGHAAVAVAIATVSTPYLGPKSKTVVWALAGLVCLARVYVGAHLPLDVIGGAGFGLAVGALVNLVVGRPNGHDVGPSESDVLPNEGPLTTG
jgi:membrane-associated phospholipid phosphatase